MFPQKIGCMKTAFNYKVPFPGQKDIQTPEDEYFYVELKGKEHKICLHDYARIYTIAGLYEGVVSHKLDCQSPKVVASLLLKEIRLFGLDLSIVRAIDFGAGCGLVGEILHRGGVQSIVGIDTIPEAATAAQRDRPGVYKNYHIADICNLHPSLAADLKHSQFNTLICVSAMALGHVSPAAFAHAFNLITNGGWIAFNILQKAYKSPDDWGLYNFFSQIIKDGNLEVRIEHIYRHRLLMNGNPIENVAVIGNKWKDIPDKILSICQYGKH